jgi:hypothetical protein
LNSTGGVLSGGVHAMDGPQGPRHRQFGVLDVHRNHLSAQRRGNLDGSEPNAAAAVNRDPFTRLHLGLIDDPVESGHEPAAQAGCVNKGNGLGQGY